MNPGTYLLPLSVRRFLLAGMAVAAVLFASEAAAASRRDSGERLVFGNVRLEAERFIDYYSSIHLTPEQERIKAKALYAIAAPCCKDYTMRTCCCPCNLAKSTWGLSNYLIAKRGYAAEQVTAAVTNWLAYVNPKGFTGDACFKGGCKRPFKNNGCGGMDATQVILGDDVQ